MKNFTKIFCVAMILGLSCVNAMAEVTIRIYDNGELQNDYLVSQGQTMTFEEGHGEVMLNSYRQILLDAGKLNLCEDFVDADGEGGSSDPYAKYRFIGWTTDENVSLNTKPNMVTSVTVENRDINIFAVYERDARFYERIYNITGNNLEDKAHYLIVAYRNNKYNAMGNEDNTNNHYDECKSYEITPDNRQRILETTINNSNNLKKCVWNLIREEDEETSGVFHWSWQNNADNNKWMRLQHNNRNNWDGSYSNVISNHTSASYVTIMWDGNNQVHRIRSERLRYGQERRGGLFGGYQTTEKYVYLNVNGSDTYFRGWYDDNEEWNRIYLYKFCESKKYVTRCTPYTVNFHACGDNSCDAAVSMHNGVDYLTESSIGSGVNFNGVSVDISCADRWTFRGWVKGTPCENLTTTEPTYITVSPYIPLVNNEDMFAVYGHKESPSATTYNYFTSFPQCTVGKVNFDGGNGTPSISPSTYLQETNPGEGIYLPMASFPGDCGWGFAGWLTEPKLGSTTQPEGLLEVPNNTTKYYPSVDEITLYAIFVHKTGNTEDLWSTYPTCEACTLTLDPGNGTVTPASYNIAVGGSQTLPSATPSCNMWTHVGWSTTKISSAVSSDPCEYAKNGIFYPTGSSATLYAIYKRNNKSLWSSIADCSAHTLTLHAHGDNTVTDVAAVDGGQTKVYSDIPVGESRTLVAATTSCNTRWAHVGWIHNSDFYSRTMPVEYLEPEATYEPAGDEHLYALHGHKPSPTATNYDYYTTKPNCTPYTITFHVCEGTMKDDDGNTIDVGGTWTKTETVGSPIILPTAVPKCYREGWSFAGWAVGREDGHGLSTTDAEAFNTGILNRATSEYYPTADVHLFAIYKKGNTSVYLVQNEEDLVVGESYFIFLNRDFQVTTTEGSVSIKYYGDNSYDVNHPWMLTGTRGSWSFFSVADQQYMYSANISNIGLSSSQASTYTIDINNNRIKNSSNNYYLSVTVSGDWWNNYNGSYITQSSTANNQRAQLYRIVAETYSSWPHCSEYTVYFDACDGTVTSASLKEPKGGAGIGVTLPTPTSSCTDKGWVFAGWAEQPINVETATPDLTTAIYPAGYQYVPMIDNIKLYAVYMKPDKDGNNFIYNKLTSISDMKLGVNSLIVYNDTWAMSNTLRYTNYYVQTSNVTASNGVIKVNNAALNWTILGQVNKYALYNPAATTYLDFYNRSNRYASLNSAEKDNFTIATYTSGGDVRFTIRSNNNNYYLDHSGSNNYFGCSNGIPNENLHIYQQQAKFHSYPCSKLGVAIRWSDAQLIVESYKQSGVPSSAGTSVVEPRPEGAYIMDYNEAPCTRKRITWDGETFVVNVPYVVTQTRTPAALSNGTDCKDCDVVVLRNATWVVENDITLNRVTVYKGGRVLINDGVTLTVNRFILNEDREGNAIAPMLEFGGENAVLNATNFYFDRRIDASRWYWFTLPFNAKVQDIEYANLIGFEEENYNIGTEHYGEYFWLKYYDGAKRAREAANGRVGSTYWTDVAATGVLKNGQGYLLAIDNQSNTNQADGMKHTMRTIRMKLAETEYSMATLKSQELNSLKAVAVEPAPSGTENAPAYHRGWNLIGNPYMRSYSTGSITQSGGMQNGHWEKELDANDSWTGKWVLASDNSSVPYITWYDTETDTYNQQMASNNSIPAYYTFFVQITNGDQVMFSEPLSAPASAPIMNTARRTPVAYTGLLLSDMSSEEFDHVGIVVSDKFTSAYEIGSDLYKMKNNGKLNVYSLLDDGAELAFNSIDENQAKSNVPLGVMIPKAGTYTFAFDYSQYDPTQVKQLLLTDFELGKTVDLLMRDYEFTIRKGTNNTRFAVAVVLNEDENTATPTSVSDTDREDAYCYTTTEGLTVTNIQKATDIRIFDLLGKQIHSAEGVTGKQHFSLPQGVYNIVLTTGNEQTTLRGIVR